MMKWYEMVRKVSNTRKNSRIHFITQAKISSDKGQASVARQNLHDTLLTQHIIVQS